MESSRETIPEMQENQPVKPKAGKRVPHFMQPTKSSLQRTTHAESIRQPLSTSTKQNINGTKEPIFKGTNTKPAVKAKQPSVATNTKAAAAGTFSTQPAASRDGSTSAFTRPRPATTSGKPGTSNLAKDKADVKSTQALKQRDVPSTIKTTSTFNRKATGSASSKRPSSSSSSGKPGASNLAKDKADMKSTKALQQSGAPSKIETPSIFNKKATGSASSKHPTSSSSSGNSSGTPECVVKQFSKSLHHLIKAPAKSESPVAVTAIKTEENLPSVIADRPISEDVFDSNVSFNKQENISTDSSETATSSVEYEANSVLLDKLADEMETLDAPDTSIMRCTSIDIAVDSSSEPSCDIIGDADDLADVSATANVENCIQVNNEVSNQVDETQRTNDAANTLDGCNKDDQATVLIPPAQLADEFNEETIECNLGDVRSPIHVPPPASDLDSDSRTESIVTNEEHTNRDDVRPPSQFADKAELTTIGDEGQLDTDQESERVVEPAPEPLSTGSAIDDVTPVDMEKTGEENEVDGVNGEPVKDVAYFKHLVLSNTEVLETHAAKWDKINQDIDVSEEIQGEIRTACCQARLVVAQRFDQFSELIYNCEFNVVNEGQGPTLCGDLDGFWTMIYYQVENVLSKFKKLEELQANDWVSSEPEKEPPSESVKQSTVKSKTPKKRKFTGRSKFAEFRAKMAAQKIKAETPDTEQAEEMPDNTTETLPEKAPVPAPEVSNPAPSVGPVLVDTIRSLPPPHTTFSPARVTDLTAYLSPSSPSCQTHSRRVSFVRLQRSCSPSPGLMNAMMIASMHGKRKTLEQSDSIHNRLVQLRARQAMNGTPSSMFSALSLSSPAVAPDHVPVTNDLIPITPYAPQHVSRTKGSGWGNGRPSLL